MVSIWLLERPILALAFIIAQAAAPPEEGGHVQAALGAGRGRGRAMPFQDGTSAETRGWSCVTGAAAWLNECFGQVAGWLFDGRRGRRR